MYPQCPWVICSHGRRTIVVRMQPRTFVALGSIRRDTLEFLQEIDPLLER